MTISSDVAERIGLPPETVDRMIEEFMLCLHRQFFEYDDWNGDFIGEELHWQVSRQAYFHFLAILSLVDERYSHDIPWTETLLRLGLRSDWEPFGIRGQMKDWKLPDRWK